MKSIIEKSPIPKTKTFECRRLKSSNFDPNWHFHPEFQLFIVIKGSGTRFIGDHVASFKPGDLVFTGPNLPHLWRSDPEYFETKKTDNTDGIVVYFNQDIFGSELLKKTEFESIQLLLHLSQRGLQFNSEISKSLVKKMILLSQTSGFSGYLILLDILYQLSSTSKYRLLSNPSYSNNLKGEDKDRMNQVQSYVFKHFRSQINLIQVAKITNMTPTSFSRYFTKHANKTFSTFVLEIRIGYSRKLLVETENNISQIAYQCGFQTLSNFNYQFKKMTQRSPSQYRKEFRLLGKIIT